MDMNGFIERFKKLATKRQNDNERGNAVYDRFFPSERYSVDFADNFCSEGWLQFDTDQDAHYFGVWLNPRLRVSLSYAEGDWTLVECPTRDSYLAEVQHMIEFYGEGQVATVIGAEGVVTVSQDRSEFLSENPAPIGIAEVLQEVLS